MKNLLIFPMKEITHSHSLLKSSKKLNVKMSNMNMNIFINLLKTKNKTKDGLWIEKSKLEEKMIQNMPVRKPEVKKKDKFAPSKDDLLMFIAKDISKKLANKISNHYKN